MPAVPVGLGAGGDRAGQSEQADDVGDDHDVVEHVGQLPDQVVAGDGAQEDEDQGDDLEDHDGALAVPGEQVLHVDLGVQVPGQDGGEGKKQQADGHKGIAEGLAEEGAEGGLGRVGLVEAHRGGDGGRVGVGAGGQTRVSLSQLAVAAVQDGDDDEGGHGDDDNRVDEDARHSDDALVMRVLDVGHGVGVGRGAHACLVGEEAALGALGHGGEDAKADAGELGLGVEGALEDEGEGGGDVLDVEDEDDQASQQVDQGHDRDDLLGPGGQALDTAQEDKAGQKDDDHTHEPGGDGEGGAHRGRDGVGLDHAAHEA